VKKNSLSVVIPCFDEMANLQKGVLDKVENFLKNKHFDYEVIIVDDGSTDGSIQFLKDFAQKNKHFQFVENVHQGKAGAVTKGMLHANGDYTLFADMDQATPIEEIDHLLPYFQKGYDVVIGSRNMTRKGSPFSRQVISWANIFLRKIIIGLDGLTDTQCGFKIFRKDVAKKLFTNIEQLHNGFHTVKGSNVSSGFDVELLYLATKMGYKIKEVPVQWLYVETRRVNVIDDSIKGFLDLLRIRKNALDGKYRIQ
jgi:dolichyl-phosphate beta-glucosyltransferase